MSPSNHSRRLCKTGHCQLQPGLQVSSNSVSSESQAQITLRKEHSAILTITLDQSTDSTKMTLSLDGVPTGMQDEIKRNLEGY